MIVSCDLKHLVILDVYAIDQIYGPQNYDEKTAVWQ